MRTLLFLFVLVIMKKAFISGISGQDGSYLSEYLCELGYEVHGIIRRHSIPENQSCRLSKLIDEGKIITYYGDLLDYSSIENALIKIMPDEIYNLAAQSHVRISFDIPIFTSNVNAIGALNMLEAYRKICPNAKYYQASSSEMFGNSVNDNGSQNENTPMHPVSPYGISKLYAYHMTRHYREAYKLFACNGILFNHESPRRGTNFVTNKIVKTAVRIKFGLDNKLVLGNLDSFRDWGHSKDYIKAMHSMLYHDKPDDFVISTGETHSIRELCEYVFKKLDLSYKDYVVQDEKFIRPEELKYLCGDSSKAKQLLGWEPSYTFKTLLDEMIQYWIDFYSK